MLVLYYQRSTSVRRTPVRMAACASIYPLPSRAGALADLPAHRARLVRAICTIIRDSKEHPVSGGADFPDHVLMSVTANPYPF